MHYAGIVALVLQKSETSLHHGHQTWLFINISNIAKQIQIMGFTSGPKKLRNDNISTYQSTF